MALGSFRLETSISVTTSTPQIQMPQNLNSERKCYSVIQKGCGWSGDGLMRRGMSPMSDVRSTFCRGQSLYTEDFSILYTPRLTAAHSFRKFGGTLQRPEDKIVCLLGLHHSAAPFKINFKTLLKEVKTVTPTAEEILNCESDAECLCLWFLFQICRKLFSDYEGVGMIVAVVGLSM
eukprot:scaffold119846_cov93-Cyclotella_meneghiniana.AAC.1